MGFDIECIIDIHNYPGEYFCPVCRTLVYPNEALQSQCTHVFCKPCLSHVANNIRACPYDGYLVTEADSKPLIQSDKAYAETIGKVKVRCLYHRSGCTWEGTLAECTSHCLGCSFGHSPVICNRCGVQIVHRQVHEHAQSCPGAYQVQQAPEGAQAVPSSGASIATVAVNPNQANSQAGFQAQKSLPAPLPPGQDSNQKSNANPQASVTVTAAVQTAEQLHQQQYQQYYQQYAGYGYDAYQQAYPQYHPYQQVPVQQYQQHPQQVLGQPNVLYGQASTQVQGQPSQAQVQSQALTQQPTQHHAQSQASVQFPAIQPQTTTQTQVQLHGSTAINSQMQPSAPPSLNQPQVNPHQLHSVMQPHGQIPSHTPHGIPPPLSQQHNSISVQPTPQPQPQTQPQPHFQAQPQPQPQPQTQPHLQPQLPPPAPALQPPPQHVQAQYPQPHLLMNNSQPSHFPLQPQMLTSQSHPTQQMQTSQSHSHLQMQPQLHPQPILRPFLPNQPGTLGSQSNQLTALGAQPNQPNVLGIQHSQSTPLSQPQLVQASGHAVSGYQSNLQPQHPSSAHPAGGSFPPNQMQVQALPQPPLMHPPSQGAAPNQSQGLIPQGQFISVTPAQQQQFHQQNQPLSYQQRPLVHSSQHPVPIYVQPLSSSGQSQQSQFHSQGPPHLMPQNSNAYVQSQQNVSVTPGGKLQQPQSYVGRPLIPNQGFPVQPQLPAQSSSGFVAGAQTKPALFGPYEHSSNQTYSSNPQSLIQTAPGQQVPQSVMIKTFGALPQGDNVSEKGVLSDARSYQIGTETVTKGLRVDSLEVKPLNPDTGMVSEQETISESTDKSRNSQSFTRETNNELHGRKDHSVQPTGQLSLKEEHNGYTLENSSDMGKQRESFSDSRFEDVESKSQKSFPKSGNETLQSTSGLVNQQKYAGVPTPPLGPSPRSQIPGYEATARPQGSQVPSQRRQPLSQNEQFQQAPLQNQPHDVALSGDSGSTTSFGRGPVPLVAPHGTSTVPPGSGDPHGGMMGRPPQNLDIDYRKLPGERGSFGHSSMESNALRMNGGLGFDRSIGSQDERFRDLPREHLKPFTKDSIWPLDQGSKSLDRVPQHGLNHDAGPMMDSAGGGVNSRFQSAYHPSGGPGITKHNMDHFPPRNPDKDYFGRKAPSFGEGSSLNLPGDAQVNPFHENGFMPGYPRRGEHYGPDGFRFGESRGPGFYDHAWRGDRLGQEIPPSHFTRGDHVPMGEGAWPGNLPQKHHYGEPFAGNKPGLPNLGEPGFRSIFSSQGFPNDGPRPGGMLHFDNSMKRKHISMGWCRICQVDCETVEGLDLHSQTREHQKMSMDMVMSIKQQNQKKSKFSSDRAGRDFWSKKRSNGLEGRGKKL